MSAPEGLKLRVGLYEGSGTAPLGNDQRFELLSALLDAGYDVSRAHCACGLPAANSAALAVLGQFEAGPTPAIGGTENSDRVRSADISGLDPDAVVASVDRIADELGARKPGAWKPWFPTIDYERCTNCKQCLSFCLFDVFGVDQNDLIQVRNPANCKTDCPACARVCPTVAIIFPKHAEGPINGDVVREQDLRRQPVQVDLAKLVGGDVHSALRTRGRGARKRFALDRDQSAGEAECACQRQRILAELGIPDQVLERLCSPGQCAEPAEDPARPRTPQRKDPPSENEWGI